MRVKLLVPAVMTSVLAVGAVGCGPSDDAQTVDSGASGTATQTATSPESSGTATQTASATATASDGSGGTKTDGASTTLSEGDVMVLQSLFAYESQARKMVEQVDNKKLSSDFTKVVGQIDSQAEDTLSALQTIADSAGVSTTLSKAKKDELVGHLTGDQEDGVGTPEGPELEQAWKALMAQQRGGAAAFAKDATVENSELKSVVAQAATQVAAQQKALQ